MKRFLIVLMLLMLSTTVLAAQQGNHNGNMLNVGIEYKNFNGFMDYSHLGLGNLPIYYIGQNMNYSISIENGKNNKYNHLVMLVTHREYESKALQPNSEIDEFSGLPYHNRIYLEDFRTSEKFDLSYWVPSNATPGAGQTDVIIYRAYDWTSDNEGNEWSYGRIILERTLGYFCP
ncbi:MAG: hypothetical protein V1672_04685 [Candidatus Diapherotrites archaeon]